MVDIDRSLKDAGFCQRGGFNPGPGDGAPDGVRGLILVGTLGGGFWEIFKRQAWSEPNPLDGWTRRVVDPLAREVGAVALYPFDGPPWLPFQRWAMKAEGLCPSPIGPLIHPEYGPWHGYRAALGFKDPLDRPSMPTARDICAACPDKPCLKGCKAGVFEHGGYDVPRCLAYLKCGGNDCLSSGCQARRACPVGASHAYGAEQGGFHSRAFLRLMDSLG